jgi:hypothetical protein
MNGPRVPSLGMSEGEGSPRSKEEFEASQAPEASGSLAMPDESELEARPKDKSIEVPIRTTSKPEQISEPEEVTRPAAKSVKKIDPGILERIPGNVAEAARENAAIGTEK